MSLSKMPIFFVENMNFFGGKCSRLTFCDEIEMFEWNSYFFYFLFFFKLKKKPPLLGLPNHTSKSSPKRDPFKWTRPHRMRKKIKKAWVWSCLGCFVNKTSKWAFAKNWPLTRANSIYNLIKTETRMVHLINFSNSRLRSF